MYDREDMVTVCTSSDLEFWEEIGIGHLLDIRMLGGIDETSSSAR